MDENLRLIVEVHGNRIAQAQTMVNAINDMSVAILSMAGDVEVDDVKYFIGEVGKAYKRYDSANEEFGSLLGGMSPDLNASEQFKRVGAL